VALRLEVVRRGEREVWSRTFGDEGLRTEQWAWRGLLVEAMGLVLCVFRLRAEGAGIVFESMGVRLGVARFSVPIPRLLGPRITARSEPQEGGVMVDVRIHAPGVGLLVAYDGRVEVKGAEVERGPLRTTTSDELATPASSGVQLGPRLRR
jgi:hypothetical protein